MKFIAPIKLAVAAILTYSAFSQMFAKETWWFIQNVNLIFHEAGHVIFMLFGSFMGLIGGALLEILVPLLITGYFVSTKQLFSAACTAWWLATAFLSVSIYAADAQERSIQLITNDPSTHDWYNILSGLNLLAYDDVVGYIFWCCSLLSVGLLIFLLFKDRQVSQFLQNFKK